MLNVARDLSEDVTEMDENVRTASSRMTSLDRLLRLAGEWNPPAEFLSSRFSIKVEQVPPFKPNSGYTIGIEMFILSFFDGNRFAYNAPIDADGVNAVGDRAQLSESQKYYASVDRLLTFEQSLAENRLRALDSMQAEGLSAVDGASCYAQLTVDRKNGLKAGEAMIPLCPLTQLTMLHLSVRLDNGASNFTSKNTENFR